MIQEMVRVEDGVPVPALPRGRTHAVEHQVVRRRRARIVAMLLRVQTRVACATPVQLVEQRREPVRMLVVDADHVVTPDRAAASIAARSISCTSSWSGTPFRN